VKVVFIGDGNNVVNSWLELASLYPMEFILGAPRGYWPDEAIVRRAQESGLSSIEITDNPALAVEGADVVYTDVWTSMGQEAETEQRKKDFAGFQVNEELMKRTPGNCLIMHCLPAHRGEEITAGVIDGPNSVVFDQAENRLHVQKAVLSLLFARRHSPVRKKEGASAG
jgi:ornithine carbamoyltransferase